MTQAKLVVHGFETSNNIKVRIALGYKGLAYEFRAIDPKDRSGIVRISGQHLTPVLQHGDTVIFDSAAILRYLDANFPDTPKLFGDSRQEQWEIEDWEMFARSKVAGPMMEVVHKRIAGEDIDAAFHAGCSKAFAKAVTALAGRLQDNDWLVGERMTAADITAGAVMYRIRAGEILAWPDAARVTDAWVERVMGYDRRTR